MLAVSRIKTAVLIHAILLTVIVAAFFTFEGDTNETSGADAVQTVREQKCNSEYMIGEEDKLLGLDDLSRQRIFFFETSGNDQLQGRQSCAVESALNHNPNSTVYIFTLKAVNRNSSTWRLFSSHDRIRFVTRNFRRHFENTPLESWFAKEIWKQSPYASVHLSDAVRLVTLWKYGGVYLDLDTVSLKPVENLRNTAGLTSETEIGNGVMIFDRLHPVLTYHMQAIQDLYNPTKWAFNGPAMLTAICRRLCAKETLKEIAEEGCSEHSNIRLMNSSAFYMVPFGRYKDFFLSKEKADFWESQLRKSSYLAHAWNKETARYRVKQSDDSLYGRLAEKECPRSYHAALQDYGYF